MCNKLPRYLFRRNTNTNLKVNRNLLAALVLLLCILATVLLLLISALVAPTPQLRRRRLRSLLPLSRPSQLLRQQSSPCLHLMDNLLPRHVSIMLLSHRPQAFQTLSTMRINRSRFSRAIWLSPQPRSNKRSTRSI